MIGAMIAIPFSPLRTKRPIVRQVWKPATRVAVGRWLAMRQTLCQEYLWNRAIVLSSVVSWSLWPSSRSAASLSRASVVIFLSASADMVSSFGRVVRGSFAPKGTRQPVWRTHGSAIGALNTAGALTGRASDLCWRNAKRPVKQRRSRAEHAGGPMAELLAHEDKVTEPYRGGAKPDWPVGGSFN